MAEYKKVNVIATTEEKFEQNKSTYPVGSIVGLTDKIHLNELDDELQEAIEKVQDISSETWTFTLSDGTTITKTIKVGL